MLVLVLVLKHQVPRRRLVGLDLCHVGHRVELHPRNLLLRIKSMKCELPVEQAIGSKWSSALPQRAVRSYLFMQDGISMPMARNTGVVVDKLIGSRLRIRSPMGAFG